MLTLPTPRSKGTGDVDDALEDVPGWLCGLGLSKKCVVPLKHMCREMFDVFSFNFSQVLIRRLCFFAKTF